MTFLIKPNFIRNDYVFFLVWLFISVSFGVYLNISNLDTNLASNLYLNSDISSYVYDAQLDFWLDSQKREFVFWALSKSLWVLFEDAFMMFLIWNLILYSVLYKGFYLIQKAFDTDNDIKDMRYLLFGIILFFPIVMGVHSFFRQVFSVVFFLLAIGYVMNNKLFKSFASSFLAIFIHNVGFLFFPILLFLSNRLIFRRIAVLMLIVMPFALNFIENSSNPFLVRNHFHSGDLIAYLYILICLLIFSFFLFLESLKSIRNNLILPFCFITFLIYTISAFTLESTLNAERILFYMFTLFYPVGAYYVYETFTNKIGVKALYFHLSLIPLIHYYNTIGF